MTVMQYSSEQQRVFAKSAMALLFLAAAGAVGNYFTLRLFPGAEYLFGSIAVLLAIRLFGPVWGIVAAGVSVLPFMLSGHPPFLPILFSAEALIVGLAYRRTGHGVALLSSAYWLLIGMPATWLLHRYFGGDGGGDDAVYFMLRNGINGITNAFLAGLLLQLPVLLGRPLVEKNRIPLRRVVFTLLVSSALVPALFLTVVSIRQQQAVVESGLIRELESATVEVFNDLADDAGLSEGKPATSDYSRIAKVLRRHSRDGELRLTLLESGRIWVASHSSLFPGQAYAHGKNISLRVVHSEKQDWVQRGETADTLHEKDFYYELETSLPGKGNLALLVEIPAASYQQAIQQSLAGALLTMLGIVLLAFLLGRLFSDRLTSPLARLAEASTRLRMKVVEGGVLNLPASPIAEVDTLVENFSDMAVGLEGSFKAISRAHGELERRVNERTQALFETNRQMEVEIAERRLFETKLSEHSLILEKTLLELETQKFALDQHSIVAITDRSGKITYVNDKLCEISQYAREELLGQDSRLLNSGYHPKSFFADMWRTIGHGEVWRGEIRNRKKDGSFYWVETTIVPFLDDSGKPYQYVAIRTDITASRQAMEVAEQANRAKSEFLSRMSHELRTPLNAVLGFAQLLESDPTEPLTESQSASVKHIAKAGWHLLELVNEVLDLARIEAGKMQLHLETVLFDQTLQECIDLVEPLSNERHIKVENQISGCEGLQIRVDRTRLKQVLLNLLSNAVKYNREGGTITLGCSHLEGGRLRVSVTDTGAGIPRERLGELFMPFSRLDADKSQIQGTGVGLAVAKRLMELMEGGIGVESRVGEGSTFWIDLPEQSGQVEPDVVAEVSETGLPVHATHTLLYVEDDESDLALVTDILKKQRPGIRLVSASTAERGFELLRSVKPDAILMDLNLSGMGGVAALGVLQEDASLYSIPVVAVSISDAPHEIAFALEAGFSDYVTKPIEIGKLLAAVDRVINA